MSRKVLHIITGLNDGGAEGVLTRLCLHSKKVEHVVISLTSEGKYGSVLVDSGVEVHSLGMNPGMPSIVKFFRLVGLIRSVQPDLVQTWMYHADLLGGVAARLAGVSRVFWGIRNSTLDKTNSKRSTIMIARICAYLSSWVPEKIVCCANKASIVHADIGYDESKMLVIANGYNLLLFKPDVSEGVRVRRELGFGTDDFVVGMVARFDSQKDHLNLLQAIALADQKVDVKCLLVGKGLTKDNDVLMDQICRLNLQEKFVLAGQRTDISSVMNSLDLHVLSSAYGEAFPNVIAEAMACGTPCVATDVGDALDILGDDRTICPAKDSASLAELIVAMAHEWQRNPADWKMRKNLSAERIKSCYSIDSMVSDYESYWFGEIN